MGGTRAGGAGTQDTACPTSAGVSQKPRQGREANMRHMGRSPIFSLFPVPVSAAGMHCDCSLPQQPLELGREGFVSTWQLRY